MTTSAVQKPFRQKNRIIFLWLFAALVVAVMILGRPALSETSPIHEIFEVTGFLLVLTGVFGRLWSILYIGNKKNASLVATGPYSVTRHPLYFSSTIAVTGAGLFYGSIALAAALCVGSCAVFYYTAKREEKYLQGLFGTWYGLYAETVPLFWPDFRLFKSDKEVTFSTRALATTFRDAVFLVLLYPALELLEYLHVHNLIIGLFQLP
jgi:protein-S-isoprenylcysteine O-methyltransferase Ste14